MPEHEITESITRIADAAADDGILTIATSEKLEKWQVKSALGHWYIMRTVLPAVVWENW
jgi:hypothetical protein